MNPLIEEFWKKVGYVIVRLDPDLSDITSYVKYEYRYIWYFMKEGFYINVAGTSELFNESYHQQDVIKCHFYMFDGKQYLEKDMLRILKMKAFI